MTLPIIWTKHAIERAKSRFGFDASIEIPNGKLRVAAMKVGDGKCFRVQHGRVIYVCIRQDGKCKIKTVYGVRPYACR